MNEYDVRRLAAVLAIQAEIEGMKVLNIVKQSKGKPLEYTEYHFNKASLRLSDLAHCHNEQL